MLCMFNSFCFLNDGCMKQQTCYMNALEKRIGNYVGKLSTFNSDLFLFYEVVIYHSIEKFSMFLRSDFKCVFDGNTTVYLYLLGFRNLIHLLIEKIVMSLL